MNNTSLGWAVYLADLPEGKRGRRESYIDTVIGFSLPEASYLIPHSLPFTQEIPEVIYKKEITSESPLSEFALGLVAANIEIIINGPVEQHNYPFSLKTDRVIGMLKFDFDLQGSYLKLYYKVGNEAQRLSQIEQVLGKIVRGDIEGSEPENCLSLLDSSIKRGKTEFDTDIQKRIQFIFQGVYGFVPLKELLAYQKLLRGYQT